MNTSIILQVEIAATPENVYEAVTTQRGLAGWYTPDVATEEQQAPGSLVTFRFGELATLVFKVEELEPDRRVVWSSVQGPDDWKQSRITFELASDGHMTTLQFTQRGLPAAYERLGTFSYLWGQYLRSIKLLLETGTGEPFGSVGSKLAGTTPPNAEMSRV